MALVPLLGICPDSRAELPAITLTSVFPPGARAGTVVEVAVAGGDLEDLAELRFSHPGIFAKHAVDPAGKPQGGRFVVAVAPNVPAGAYDVRAVGRFGVSLPRTFEVGDQPEAVETAGNESPGGATELAVGSVVSGVCAAAGGVDHFKFNAKQGQRVLIECAARSIDSRLEPVVALADSAGRELGRSRTGGVIDFAVPSDGQYLLQVHDVTFRGGPAFFYRLSVSAKPFVDFVLPPAGVAGTRGKYVLYGRNLPNGTPVEGMTVDGKTLQQLAVEIELPADGTGPARVGPLNGALAAARGYEYRLRTDRGVSNGVFIAYTDAAPVAEGANDDSAQPAKVSAPSDVAGQFFPQRDRDWFSFDAKKGEAWWVEVFSERLGAATDPFLLVQRVTKNEKGETQSADVQEVYDSAASAGGADYNTASRDPVYRIEAKEDASYRLQVRDLFNTTADDPRLAYVLSVRKDKPDFQVLVGPMRNKAAEVPQSVLLRRGGAWPVRVVALRRDGFNGEISLSVEGLPPGVSCGGGSIPAGATSATLVLTAAEDAASWAGPIRVVGKADVGGASVVREARGAFVVAGNGTDEAVRSRVTADFAVAVNGSDPAPLSIGPAEAKPFEAPAGGKVAVPLKLTWRGDASGKVKLKVGGSPPLDNFTEAEVAAKAPAATVEIDLNRHKLAPGTHTLYVRAEGKVVYTRLPEALKAAGEAKGAADQAALDAAAAAKAAAEKLAAAKAGADAEATKAAEKAAAEADAAVKAAEQKKTEAAARAKALEPKEVEGVFYSAPVVVKVVEKK